MSETHQPAPAEKSVRVYNRSPRRSFLHEPFRLAPSSFLEVPASVAKNWITMFPGDVVEAGTAQRELSGLGAELAETKAKLASAEAQLANLKTDPKGDKARADLEAANSRIKELEKQLAKLSPKRGADAI